MDGAISRKDIDDVAILVYRTPQILAFTTNRYENLIEEPNVTQSALMLA
jgi:hypothetical protein